METLSAPQTLRLQRKPAKFVAITLVGCGGTGSHIASGLPALVQALAARQVHVELVFQDPDVVEAKNIGRQLFAPRDLGKPKARALADRLNGAYGLQVGAVAMPITKDATLMHPDADLNLVIGAVDNAAARQIMAAAVSKAQRRLWWLDAGNENASGQVALGNCSAQALRGTVGLGLVDRLPAPNVVYPDMVMVPKLTKALGRAKKNGKAPSCAELAAAGEQGLMVNRMAAAWALALLHDFLLGEVNYFALAFDLRYGGVKRFALDVPTLSEVAKLPADELQVKAKA